MPGGGEWWLGSNGPSLAIRSLARPHSVFESCVAARLGWMSAVLRVGSPAFLVARPLDLGLEQEPGIELLRAVPARLSRVSARRLARRGALELDRALPPPGYRYSTARCLRPGRDQEHSALPARPLESVRRVVLDPASRAAQTLTRIVPATAGPGLRRVRRDRARPGPGPGGRATGRRRLARHRRRGPTPGPRTPGPAELQPQRRLDVGHRPAVRLRRLDHAPGLELSEGELSAFSAARDRGGRALEALASEASRSWSLPLAACRRYLLESAATIPATSCGRRSWRCGTRPCARAVRARARPRADPPAGMPRLIEERTLPALRRAAARSRRPRACPTLRGLAAAALT